MSYDDYDMEVCFHGTVTTYIKCMRDDKTVNYIL